VRLGPLWCDKRGLVTSNLSTRSRPYFMLLQAQIDGHSHRDSLFSKPRYSFDTFWVVSPVACPLTLRRRSQHAVYGAFWEAECDVVFIWCRGQRFVLLSSKRPLLFRLCFSAVSWLSRSVSAFGAFAVHLSKLKRKRAHFELLASVLSDAAGEAYVNHPPVWFVHRTFLWGLRLFSPHLSHMHAPGDEPHGRIRILSASID